ncbi:uncharacterized protein LOC132624434 [Lycium barbarum]|uniref:uncharacterized protein LOC132624434 n=1 Tax=Lycium barbarum TaxID=112863 RepID=UPI00293EF99D|nr:uncharacterized protein LOC132624434 [Lycium barbarum]
MDVESPEFQDWELLHSNPTSHSEPVIPSGSATNGLDEVGSETGGMIQPNYFSIDSSQSRYMTNFSGSEEGSEESDNPSWIEPGSENQFITKNYSEFWSDSGSDRSQTRTTGEREGIEETRSENGEFGDFEEGQNSHLQDGSEKKENGNVEGEKKKMSIVWWKVPIELFKYWGLRVGPAWTFSVAAAVAMGFVILGRRLLYKMKKKAKKLELKVSVNDKKKVSQFMSRSARLNEAFSIVKLVPVIRPQLPAPGITLWPAMSLT